LLFTSGATAVSPFEVTVKVDQIDGTISTLVSDDTITLPRGVFLIADTITVSYK
jgi:hypothetical protein